MSKKFNPEKAERLLSRERYQDLKPDILLHKLAVPPGSTLLDLGCGNGFFTFPAAVAMGEEGMVIAADTSEAMLQLLNRRVPPENVQVLPVKEVEMDVDPNSVDAVVAIAVYHEFKDAQENLGEMKRVLVPNGKILIVDWDPNGLSDHGPGRNHRVALDQAIQDVETAGFKVLTTEKYTEDVWLLIAEHPA